MGVSMPRGRVSMNSFMRAEAKARSARARSISAAGSPRATFSSSVPSAMKTFCDTYPTVFCQRRRFSSVRGTPSMAMRPAVGA